MATSPANMPRVAADPAPRPAAARRRSLLHIAMDGPEAGEPWLVLHDRHGDLGAARSLGARHLDPGARRIAVRSARTQTRGSLAPPKGNFWYIGPLARPELSTLGDALCQLDRLLDDLRDVDGLAPLKLLGQGEGATVALLLALLRPDRIRRVAAIDAEFPENFDRMPLRPGPTDGLSVMLRGDPQRVARTATGLRRAAPGLAVRIAG